MEPSEVIAALVSFILGVAVWGLWQTRVLAVHPLLAKPGASWVMPSAFGAFTSINFVVLRTIAASDVRNDPRYLGFYLVLGLGVSAIVLLGLGAFGIRPADLSQRHNAAAGVFVVLAVAGSGFAYAGANIGEGPGFHVVLFCALLSLGALFAILVLHAAIAHTLYRVLVDRDVGAAFRAGCMLVACGICLGRAAGGTWSGVGAAFTDFGHYGWPAAALGAVDAVAGRTTRASAPDRTATIDIVAGLSEIALAAAYVGAVGIPT